MTFRYVVRVAERGHTDISSDAWRRLATAESFWKLVDRKIVSVSHPGASGARLHGGAHVGRVACGDVLLELHEKIPGALQALLQFASHETFHVAAAPSPGSELGELVVLLIRQFLGAVTRYVTRGRQAIYVRERRTGSLAGGRLRLADTVRLRARGLGHLMAFERNAISHQTDLNRVVYAALREVERIADLVALPAEERARARAFSMLFSDCGSGRLPHEERARLTLLAEQCARKETTDEQRDLAALAAVVLAHQSFDRTAGSDLTVPRAWFLNLERLFETACRAVLRHVCRGTFVVERGDDRAPHIFGSERREFRAHPDIVLRAEEAHGVGDIKYKDWNGSADASDIYQLLVHASAFETDCCFLIFPSDRYDVRELGSSVTGAVAWLFAVDIRMLDRDLRRVIAATGLASLAEVPRAAHG